MSKVIGLSDGDLKQKMLRKSEWTNLYFPNRLNQNEIYLFT